MGHLVLEGVAKRFGKIEALQHIDLEVEDGEFFVILGPSAAGKTTTLRAIAGLEKLDTGRIVLDGVDMAEIPVQQRGIAMVFQSFALYPHLSTASNLAYPLREEKVPRRQIQQRVHEIAEMLGITHTLKRKPASLSGGEQQRLAIGRALIRNPKLLLLDEPLTNLDAKLRHDMRAEFKRLHRELGMTMVYATPDQLEALSMGQRIGVIIDGKIVQTETPAMLYDAPRDREVARLVGDPPMNFIPGILRHNGAGPSLELPFMNVQAADLRDSLTAFDAGTEFFLGVRPQDIKLAGNGETEGAFDAEIAITEPQGDITILDLKAASEVLQMVVPEAEGARHSAGEEIRVRFNPRDGRLFMKDSGVLVM
ncbi:MAG: Maltose/maltodextrin import ATP-binding protein MalK [Alphaproteobacteria bacterium MarineAlpha10_Bin1]|nr:MAG: Maltose/maltodextrin import ATP-binding protein MalK [Alphaproteobacteria bacterium MarineAlpha10_Bin1]